MRTVYRKRRDVLLEEIERRLGGTLTVVNGDAGLHLTAWLPQHIDDRDVARGAARRGVSVTALSTLYAGESPKSGLILGFGGADEETIARAVETLARTIDEARRC
jgi:GntR family transcriptional regulator/MocR family aminotransferase